MLKRTPKKHHFFHLLKKYVLWISTFTCKARANIATKNLLLQSKLLFSSNADILRIWSHLLKKTLMENFIFCAV